MACSVLMREMRACWAVLWGRDRTWLAPRSDRMAARWLALACPLNLRITSPGTEGYSLGCAHASETHRPAHAGIKTSVRARIISFEERHASGEPSAPGFEAIEVDP